MRFLSEMQWSPYIVGLGIGVFKLVKLFDSKKSIKLFHIICQHERYDRKTISGKKSRRKTVLPKSKIVD